MWALGKLITNAFGTDVYAMENKASQVNKKYAGIFR
jgi:hypothetical protein